MRTGAATAYPARRTDPWGYAVRQRRLYEIRVHGYPSMADALDAQSPIQRVLCPDPDHAPPCGIPWSTGVADDGAAYRVTVGIYATPGQADDVAEDVCAHVGHAHDVTLVAADEPDYADLVEQFRIEHTPD